MSNIEQKVLSRCREVYGADFDEALISGSKERIADLAQLAQELVKTHRVPSESSQEKESGKQDASLELARLGLMPAGESSIVSYSQRLFTDLMVRKVMNILESRYGIVIIHNVQSLFKEFSVSFHKNNRPMVVLCHDGLAREATMKELLEDNSIVERLVEKARDAHWLQMYYLTIEDWRTKYFSARVAANTSEPCMASETCLEEVNIDHIDNLNASFLCARFSIAQDDAPVEHKRSTLLSFMKCIATEEF